MKQFTISSLLFLLLFSSGLLAQTTQPEQLTIPLTNPGKTYTLKVALTVGALKITGYSGKEVLVNTSGGDSKLPDAKSKQLGKLGNDNDEASGMRRISGGGGYEVTARENDNTITIESGNTRRKGLVLELKVPQDVKLKVVTTSSAVEISDLKAEVEVTSTNGAIRLINISGSVVASTTNGNITASFSSVNAQAPMAFTTFNGTVNVSFPADTKANFKLNSESGEVYTDFDMDIDKTHPQANPVSKEQGVYKISRSSVIYGKINGGGPEISLKTFRGNIYVKKAIKQ